MIVKMMCTFDFNPETNEYTPIGEPEIVKSRKVTKKKEDESTEPQLILDENKYSLNSAAIELLGVEAGDKLDIKYQIIDNINYPIIGPSTIWNSNSGNKLTKSGTVSYRGKANIALSEQGSLFTFTPWKEHEGLFVLIGDEPPIVVEQDENIEIPVDDELDTDIKIKDDEELDFSDFEEKDTELKEFKFKF